MIGRRFSQVAYNCLKKVESVSKDSAKSIWLGLELGAVVLFISLQFLRSLGWITTSIFGCFNWLFALRAGSEFQLTAPQTAAAAVRRYRAQGRRPRSRCQHFSEFPVSVLLIILSCRYWCIQMVATQGCARLRLYLTNRCRRG